MSNAIMSNTEKTNSVQCWDIKKVGCQSDIQVKMSKSKYIYINQEFRRDGWPGDNN